MSCSVIVTVKTPTKPAARVHRKPRTRCPDCSGPGVSPHWPPAEDTGLSRDRRGQTEPAALASGYTKSFVDFSPGLDPARGSHCTAHTRQPQRCMLPPGAAGLGRVVRNDGIHQHGTRFFPGDTEETGLLTSALRGNLHSLPSPSSSVLPHGSCTCCSSSPGTRPDAAAPRATFHPATGIGHGGRWEESGLGPFNTEPPAAELSLSLNGLFQPEGLCDSTAQPWSHGGDRCCGRGAAGGGWPLVPQVEHA